MSVHVDPKKILIVDDDLANVATIAQILLRNGYDVLHEEDEQRVVRTAKKSRPDLIICNAESRKLDAFRTVEAVRQVPRMRGVPVLFLTESKELSRPGPGLLGPKQYLRKPFTPEQLAIAVQENLRYMQAKRK